MFKNRQRVEAAFAKGLMFGKAVGARDERDRIIKFLEQQFCIFEQSVGNCECVVCRMTKWHIGLIKGDSNER